MTIAATSFSRDANFVPITTRGLIATKTIAFDGTAGNGAVASPNVALFTVTGTVWFSAFGVCSEDLVSAGGGTLALGGLTGAQSIIANTTATTIDSTEVWLDTTPAKLRPVTGAIEQGQISNGDNIIATVGTADITDGTITFYCIWVPISSDGNVVAS